MQKLRPRPRLLVQLRSLRWLPRSKEEKMTNIALFIVWWAMLTFALGWFLRGLGWVLDYLYRVVTS